MTTRLIVASLLVVITFGACSTYNPTQAEIDSAGSDEEYWRATYQRQCVNSGVQPGTPALLKCVDDLMDIRNQPQ